MVKKQQVSLPTHYQRTLISNRFKDKLNSKINKRKHIKSMFKISSILFVVTTIFLTTACTIPAFHSAQGENTAQVSFSSQMPNLPELQIGINCQSYLVSNEKIDDRSPQSRTKKVFRIPSGKEIFLYFENMEIGRLVLWKHLYIDLNASEQQHGFDTCSNKISFKPEKDKNYEIFFGATSSNECHIFVKQVSNDIKSRTKKFEDVKINTSPAC